MSHQSIMSSNLYNYSACNISSFPALTNPPSLSPSPSLESHLCNYLSLLMLKSARERLSFLSLAAAAAAASRVMMMSGRNDVTRSVTNSGILGVRAPLPHPIHSCFLPGVKKTFNWSCRSCRHFQRHITNLTDHAIDMLF